MNYLAHIYLSGNDKHLKLGNFIADFIKPNELALLPHEQQLGVKLHQKIDRFTDTHPEVRKVRELFFVEFRHYSAVLVDVIFDHYLAKNWKKYHAQSLALFAQDFYQLLKTHQEDLPYSVQQVIPHIIRGDWLTNYAKVEGLEMILKQMNNRTSNKTSLHLCISTLMKNNQFIEQQFFLFFKELIAYCMEEILSMKLN